MLLRQFKELFQASSLPKIELNIASQIKLRSTRTLCYGATQPYLISFKIIKENDHAKIFSRNITEQTNTSKLIYFTKVFYSMLKMFIRHLGHPNSASVILIPFGKFSRSFRTFKTTQSLIMCRH